MKDEKREREMGRVKLQIKRIENTTNRQVTFSKRRNGLIKKAYELSVLCDVDVALIMFSPSGRLSLFSGGNKSIEEILTRYVNLPEHERGRLHNQEFLQRALGKMKAEVDNQTQTHQATSPANPDSQIEEFKREIVRYKSQIEDLENQIRIFEDSLSDVNTLSEAEQQEHILEETLKRVRIRKQVLEETYKSSSAYFPVETTAAEVNALFAAENPTNMLAEWLPQRDPQVQISNFLDSNGLLPCVPREEPQRVVEMLGSPAAAAASRIMHGQNMNFDDHIATTSGLEEDSNIVQRVSFGQAIDVNLSPWTEFYQTGNCPIPGAQPRERALLQLYLSQFTPSNILTSDHQPP